MTPNGQLALPGDTRAPQEKSAAHHSGCGGVLNQPHRLYGLARAAARGPQFYGERLPSPTDAQTSGHHCSLDLP